MTPERVKAIAEPVAEIADECCYRGDPWYSHVKSAIERAITVAVNEALSEAKKCAESEAMFWADTDDTRAHKAARLIADNIDALKLPEEP